MHWLTCMFIVSLEINKYFKSKIVNTFLSIYFNICFWCYKDDGDRHPAVLSAKTYVFKENKKVNFILQPYVIKGLQPREMH